MPQRGSRWDKVLKWAEFFALQISGYEKAVSPFISHGKGAVKLIWAACRVLIEVSVLLSQYSIDEGAFYHWSWSSFPCLKWCQTYSSIYKLKEER
jgi:hypothetical protein